jgi:hypothetical protein
MKKLDLKSSMNKNYVGLEVPLARWTSIDGKV